MTQQLFELFPTPVLRIERLLEDDGRREELARRISTLATPRAADEVAGRLLGVATKEAGP